MRAYSGAIVESIFWDKFVIDIVGMRLQPKLPALREHNLDKPVGVIDKHYKKTSELTASGYFLSSKDGQEIATLLDERFPMQSSIGVWFEEIEIIGDGEKAMVNGKKHIGPLTVIRQAYCREISFCVLGADDQTSVDKLAAGAMTSNTMAKNMKGEKMTKIPLKTKLETHPFMVKVKKIMNDKACSKHQAMLEAVRKFPDDHEAFIRLANQG